MISPSKISVTVVTGFLGAGKTTFINQVLKSYPDIQFALVENEFGEVSIDSKLIKGVDASQMFELKQGCICCTISDEYELVLAELAERFPNVEHLLIETTGIADPAPVISPFFKDEKLKKVYQFSGTVCIVDALNFTNQLKEDVTLKQVAVADLVIISKMEKVSESEKQNLIVEINRINPLCEISCSGRDTATDYNPNHVFYKTKFYLEMPVKRLPHSGITSKTLSFQKPLNRKDFINWLSYNLDVYKTQIYRVKGILCFENEPYEFILQGVGGSFEITEGENLSENFISQVILIGIEIPELEY